MKRISIYQIGLISCSLLWLIGCTPSPPQNIENLCEIFKDYPGWYWDAKKTADKWGVPISIQMAIIHQESGFDGQAKPDRTKLLWVIPWKRPSSAYGYSQALKTTWQHYQTQTGQNNSRDHFAAASDFIGWYAQEAHRRAGIDKHNAFQLYLAYHEGVGGYQKKTYRKKVWLMNVAKKVQSRSSLYQAQLSNCQHQIKKPWW